MSFIETLSTEELDKIWAELDYLEAQTDKTAIDLKKINKLMYKIEMNARKRVWQANGIRVIVGGKGEKAA